MSERRPLTARAVTAKPTMSGVEHSTLLAAVETVPPPPRCGPAGQWLVAIAKRFKSIEHHRRKVMGGKPQPPPGLRMGLKINPSKVEEDSEASELLFEACVAMPKGATLAPSVGNQVLKACSLLLTALQRVLTEGASESRDSAHPSVKGFLVQPEGLLPTPRVIRCPLGPQEPDPRLIRRFTLRLLGVERPGALWLLLRCFRPTTQLAETQKCPPTKTKALPKPRLRSYPGFRRRYPGGGKRPPIASALKLPPKLQEGLKTVRVPFDPRFKASKLHKYSGGSDPGEFACSYALAIEASGGVRSTMAKCFPLALEGVALRWFWSLKLGSINSWEQLKKKFVSNFQATFVAPTKSQIKGLSTSSVVDAAREGVLNPDLLSKLH
ncbi:hypothetical protein GUJ93_ZPchr0004g40094 [Zizania palustris]|uniref:Retrotransposon gag domain-containing protein n=1 Tax=Zizania palustris TaxID=103762 RepID=A0A8J5V942_ZIZPA|nr:hypothetical protein GUJ93_ZPchr0004g40094 [Zizania palustris]